MKKICIILLALISLFLCGCGRELKLTGKEVVKAESVVLKELEQNKESSRYYLYFGNDEQYIEIFRLDNLVLYKDITEKEEFFYYDGTMYKYDERGNREESSPYDIEDLKLHEIYISMIDRIKKVVYSEGKKEARSTFPSPDEIELTIDVEESLEVELGDKAILVPIDSVSFYLDGGRTLERVTNKNITLRYDVDLDFAKDITWYLPSSIRNDVLWDLGLLEKNEEIDFRILIGLAAFGFFGLHAGCFFVLRKCIPGFKYRHLVLFHLAHLFSVCLYLTVFLSIVTNMTMSYALAGLISKLSILGILPINLFFTFAFVGTAEKKIMPKLLIASSLILFVFYLVVVIIMNL